jgi:hypothetical protein
MALRDAILEYMKGDDVGRAKAVVRAESIGLGRFTDAAARRLTKQNPGQAFSKAAFELAAKTTAPPAAPKVALDEKGDQNLLTSIPTN